MTSERALERFLARLLDRSTMSAGEQAAILDLEFRASKFRARADIVVPGQRVDYACLIGEGIGARFDQMRDGQRQLTAFYIPGDMCDLHSVVAPTAAWGITSVSATTVLQVPHDSLRKAIARQPNLAIIFWRDGTADASILAKWLGNIGRQDARARLAHMLCEFSVRTQAAGLSDCHSFDLPVTQDQLADAVGLTPVHVNRTLQRLRADGLIGCHGQRYDILDWDGLAATAEFNPDYLLLSSKKNEPVGGAGQGAVQPIFA